MNSATNHQEPDITCAIQDPIIKKWFASPKSKGQLQAWLMEDEAGLSFVEWNHPGHATIERRLKDGTLDHRIATMVLMATGHKDPQFAQPERKKQLAESA